MGEARNRGTKEARATQAVQRLDKLRPPALACNGCQAALTDISTVDTRSLRGIDVAFTAHCAACEQDTWAVRGEIAAVKAFYAALEKTAGEPVLMGTAKPAPSSSS